MDFPAAFTLHRSPTAEVRVEPPDLVIVDAPAVSLRLQRSHVRKCRPMAEGVNEVFKSLGKWAFKQKLVWKAGLLLLSAASASSPWMRRSRTQERPVRRPRYGSSGRRPQRR
jgi:hypothetical protein